MISVFNSKWPLPQVQVVALKELSSCSMKGPLEGRRYGASSFYRFIGGTHMHHRATRRDATHRPAASKRSTSTYQRNPFWFMGRILEDKHIKKFRFSRTPRGAVNGPEKTPLDSATCHLHELKNCSQIICHFRSILLRTLSWYNWKIHIRVFFQIVKRISSVKSDKKD